ncbi:MAG: dipeptidase [Pseudomonadota bacterium]
MRAIQTISILIYLTISGNNSLYAETSSTIHRDAIVIDTHSDFLDRSEIDGSGLATDIAGAQTTLGKLKDGDVDAQFFSVFVPPAYEDLGFKAQTDTLIDRMLSEINTHQNDIELATSVADIERLANTGKIAALLGIEGGHSLEGSIENLDHFYQRGVRYLTLSWSNTNAFADASGGEVTWQGLSPLGEQLIERMNALGMMVDISHVSDDTFWDVIKKTKTPIIASHSSARALADHPRNMSDEMIKALAANGGVVQINFYSRYVDLDFLEAFRVFEANNKERFDALAEAYGDDPVELDKHWWSLEKEIEATLTAPTLDQVVDHIVYVIDLVGDDHVGLGSDFDGMGAPPAGLEHIGKIKGITDELIARAYSENTIKKVLGENTMRVMRENEKFAARSMATEFWQNLSQACGNEYEGEMTFPTDGQDSFRGKKLIAAFASCADEQIRVPFTVGEDTSRTWIFSRYESGIELKHDHRHADGTPDAIHNYGGTTHELGTALSQSFPADEFTKELIPAASTNVWTITLSADLQTLTYHLERHGKPRFTAELVLKTNSTN